MAKNGSGRNGMGALLGQTRPKERGFWSPNRPKTRKMGARGQKFGQKNRSQQFFWHEFLTHGLLVSFVRARSATNGPLRRPLGTLFRTIGRNNPNYHPRVDAIGHKGAAGLAFLLSALSRKASALPARRKSGLP